MILQALVAYYNGLAARGEISKSGWAKAKISWAVELGDDGSVLGILPLTTMSADGKKQIPRKILLPAPITKASSVRSNFLWESAGGPPLHRQFPLFLEGFCVDITRWKSLWKLCKTQ